MTALGVREARCTTARTSSPEIGSTAKFIFLASCSNAGSLAAAMNAARNIFARSAGMAAGAAIGNAMKNGISANSSKARSSGLSVSSLAIGVSPSVGKRVLRPNCTRATSFPASQRSRMFVAKKLTSPNWPSTSLRCYARLIADAPGYPRTMSYLKPNVSRATRASVRLVEPADIAPIRTLGIPVLNCSAVFTGWVELSARR